MIGFLDSVYEGELLVDYKTFLKEEKSEQANCLEKKCDQYYQKIFGGKSWFDYNYQQWSSKDFMTIDDTEKRDENRIFKLYIDDKNKDEVCEFFKHFVCLFRQMAVEELGGKVVE